MRVLSRDPIGDVRCLNCSRALAQLVPAPDGTKLRLLPAANQSQVQVTVAGRRLLRCRHCGGRAFIELHEEASIEELAESIGRASPSAASAVASMRRHPDAASRSLPGASRLGTRGESLGAGHVRHDRRVGTRI